MTNTNDISTGLEKFDDLFVGNPQDIEKNLTTLLAEAKRLEDKSIYLQILSQIALTQAMQGKFNIAHQTLDEAEKLLEPKYKLAQIRIILERGRCFQQEMKNDQALPLFKESYELSKKNGFNFHTVNAAHMVAIAEKNPAEKIKWNNIALEIAMTSSDEKAKTWLGPLHNNLAQNYIEIENFKSALKHFEKCKEYAEIRKDEIVIRGAKWGIARSKRGLGFLFEALNIQNQLLNEYEEVAQNNALPIEIIRVGRGLVYEELAEIHFALSKQYATLCLHDLSQDQWAPKMMAERFDRMDKLKNTDLD